MKITSLLISILVFLMSGVMCLFSTSEVFAEVPQTKRSEQDSFLKNIRAKKRNNDLQKARQQKINLDSSDDWKIRIRHQSGKYNEEEGENRSDYKKDVTDVKIWTLIIGKIGFSNLKQDYYSIRDVLNNSELIAFNKTNLESTILSYTFGNNITLTIGTTIENKGNISIGEKSVINDEHFNVHNSTKISNQYGSFISYIDTITIGFELYGFEFLIGTGKQDFEFKDLECDGGDINCDKSAYEVYNSGKFENYWMDFGIGIVF